MAFLSKKKEKWLLSRAKIYKGVFVGKNIGKNAIADAFYRKAIEKEFIKYIEAFYNDLQGVYGVLQVNNAIKTPKVSVNRVLDVIKKYKGAKLRIFLKNADKIIRKWLKKASQSTNKNIQNVLFEMAGKEITLNYNRDYDNILKLIIDRNVQLITNVSSQTLTNIENIVFDGMTTGGGWGEIEKTLKEQKVVADNRIKLIARDQTAKANATLNELQQRDAGIKFFMWRTMGDERVSTGKGGHKQLDGKIYAWDEKENYPVIDSYGNTGLPSQRPNCRCVALPVWILKGYKPVKQFDGSYKIEKDE
ncbi:minor capsid protein [bacterium]|nr:minor capsid protein [bacterium]